MQSRVSVMTRWFVIAIVAISARAHANAGKPWGGGSYAGELDGIGAIAIAREELVIDLRPLAADELVAVSATYHLVNASDTQHLDLVFASGSETAAFRVALDGRDVPYASAPTLALPASWHAPASTPMFDGRELDYELAEGPMPIGFRLDVPPGRHDLAIAYRADAIRHHIGLPTLVRQFAYVLAPARTWASFGGLDVTVRVPSSWRAAVTPPLARDGDTLHATFATVPADAIALSVQAPTGAYAIVAVATRVLFGIVGLGGVFVVAWRTRVRERRRQWRSKLAALGRGFAWGVAVLATGLLAVGAPDRVLPAGQADHYGYGEAFALVGVVLATFLAIAIGWIVSIVVGRRVHTVVPPDELR